MSSTSTTWTTDTNTKSGTVQVYTSNVSILKILGIEGGNSVLELFADEGDDNADKWRMWVNASDDDLHFANYTSGSWANLLTIQDGGNVGIATDSPSSKLHVVGSASLDGAVVINDSSADVDFRVESNGNANMLFIDGGNDKIGIGTAAPNYDFTVSKDAASPQIGLICYDDDTDVFPYMVLGKADGTESDPDLVSDGDNLGRIAFQGWDKDAGGNFVDGAFIQCLVDGASPGENDMPGELQFWTNDGIASAEQRMTILANGFIGMGTALPQMDLHISENVPGGNAANGTIAMGNAATGNYGVIGNKGSSTGKLDCDSKAASGTSHGHSWSIDASVKMQMISTGKVGIGILAPTSHIHVHAADGEADNAWVGQFANLESTAGRNKGVNIRAGSNASDMALSVDDYSGANSRFVVRGDGNVGIGTSAPGTLLEARGGTGTGAASAGVLTLSTSETSIRLSSSDQLGRIDFQAPVEGGGTDAILVGASIGAVCEEDFAADNNSTGLFFSTGTTTVPIERMRIDQDGNVGIATDAPGNIFEIGSPDIAGNNRGLTFSLGTNESALTIQQTTSGTDSLLECYAGTNPLFVVGSKSTIIGAGMQRAVFNTSIIYADSADQSVAVQCKAFNTEDIMIPAGSIITHVSAVVTEVSNITTHKVNITTSTIDSLGADAVEPGTSLGTLVEILGAGASGTQSTDSASVEDIDMKEVKEVWVCTTLRRIGAADVFPYVFNAGTGNGTAAPTTGILAIVIEWCGIT